MLQVQGIFLTFRFNQEDRAGEKLNTEQGKNPAFPTCMNFFLFGRVVETQELSLFSLGLLLVFSAVCFITPSLLVAFYGSSPPRV